MNVMFESNQCIGYGCLVLELDYLMLEKPLYVHIFKPCLQFSVLLIIEKVSLWPT